MRQARCQVQLQLTGRSMEATPAPGKALRLTTIYAVLSGVVWRFSKQEELREGRVDSVFP